MPSQINLPFIVNAKISMKKIPNYIGFKGLFNEPVDITLGNMLCEDEIIPKATRDLFKSTDMDNVKPNGDIAVNHSQRNDLGRFYGDGDVSLIPHSRLIKHTLMLYGGWSDLDMIKGHATIAKELFKGVIPMPFIENYLNNFDAIVDIIVNHFSNDETPLPADDVKNLHNMSIYGGGRETWIKSIINDKPSKGYVGRKMKNIDTTLDIIDGFIKECQTISSLVNKENPSLVKKLKKGGDSSYDTKNRVVSYFYQTIENHILYIAYQYLVGKGIITARRCGLEYDGLCFPPNGSVYDKDTLTEELNTHIFTETGLHIKFKFKGYAKVRQDLIDERRNIVVAEVIIDGNATDIIVVDDAEPVEPSKDTSNAIYKKLVVEFEKQHTKIINKSLYVKKTDDTIILMSESSLIASYKHMECGVNKAGHPVSFITKWINFNDKINKKQDMGIYPNVSLCPSYILNLWFPFAMESLKHKPYRKHTEGLNIMLNHIKILSGNEEVIYIYFIKWIAMMFQQPEIKTTCIILVSEEGAGKGGLMELFKKMMGELKVLETSKPDRDVWGAFNGLMTKAYLVNINELEHKQTKDAEAPMKTLVSDKSMIINMKGKDQITINSCHKVIITTNKDKCITTHSKDRRNVIVRSSDELIGNTVYFNNFFSLLDNEDVIRTCYDYFKTLDLTGFDYKTIPKTAYHDDLNEATQSPVLTWLNHLTYDNRKVDVLPQMNGAEIFDLFKIWCYKNNKKFETDAVNLGRLITNLKIKGITEGKRVNNFRTKLFNIAEMRVHFGMTAEENDVIATVPKKTTVPKKNEIENIKITIEETEEEKEEEEEEEQVEDEGLEYVDEYITEEEAVKIEEFVIRKHEKPFGIPVKRVKNI